MAKEKTKYPYGWYDYTVSTEGYTNIGDYFTPNEWESKSDSDKLKWLQTRADTAARKGCLVVEIELSKELAD
jgi:hypothetical protein